MAKTQPTTKKRPSPTSNKPRLRKLTRRQRRTRDKRAAQARAPLISSFKLTKLSVATLRKYWKPLGGILLVYLILNIVFANGLSNLTPAANDLKASLSSSSAQSTTLGSALGGFGSILANSGASASATSSILQSMLLVLGSLVIISALRQLLAGRTVTVKQAYYNSTSQLVPFLLIIGVIILELIPFALASSAAAIIYISTNAATIIVFSLIFVLFVAWSFYMLSSSILALYIVTLPGMQPLRALRSAKNLVRFRRWQVIRRLLFLPTLILSVMCVVSVLLIMIATFLVAPVFYLLAMLSLLFAHTYLYSFYRSLIA